MADLESALLEVLGRRTGRSDLRFARRPEPLTGGYWAEIFAFSLADPQAGFAGELVLRVMPNAVRATRDVAVQAAAAELGFATPRVCASGGPDEAFGRCFAVMERASGATVDRIAGALRRVRLLRQVPLLLADAQARLHALPVSELSAAIERRGVAPAELSVSAFLAELATVVRALAVPEQLEALAWLERARLPERVLVLCHGDLHPLNLLVDDADRATVLDWTNARLAERELDVAYTAQLFELAPLAVARALEPLIVRLGRRGSRRFQAAYPGGARLDPAKLGWYRALHALRLLANVEAARVGHGGAAPLAELHPWRIVGARASAQLREIVGG